MQNFARRLSIDFTEINVRYDMNFNDVSTKQTISNDAIGIFGLFLEGASMNKIKSTLQELQMNVLYFNMPQISIIPFSLNLKD